MSKTKQPPKNSDFINEFMDESEPEGTESSATGREDFAKMLGESLKAGGRKPRVGDKVQGKILVLGQEEVFVALGPQRDGMVQRRELNGPDGTCPYQVGEFIDLYVTQVKGNEIRLSRKVSGKESAKDLEEAFRSRLPIQGRIVEVCKGGVKVNIKGKIAFCPISQIDLMHIETAEPYVGKSFDFRITKFGEDGRDLVVSRRKLLEEERELGSASFLNENLDGSIVPGRVTRLEKFGAFVELAPGVDGLVHISEIAWSRIGDPSEVLQVGQEVTVKLLKREMVGDRPKISLSIKQVGERPAPAPGEEAASRKPNPTETWGKFSVGQVINGSITKKEVFGLFVQLEPGVVGLLHQSQTNDRPDLKIEKLKVGDSIQVQIGEIKMAERRISLRLPRDSDEDDWRSFEAAQSSSPQSSGFGTFADLLKKKK
jgi:small subunit ribosomal protein S1